MKSGHGLLAFYFVISAASRASARQKQARRSDESATHAEDAIRCTLSVCFSSFFPTFSPNFDSSVAQIAPRASSICSSSCDLSLQKPKKGKKKVIFFVDDLGSAPSPCCVGNLFMAR